MDGIAFFTHGMSPSLSLSLFPQFRSFSPLCQIQFGGLVTFAGFLLTKLSQFHPVSTRMLYPIEGRRKHEGKVAVSRSASLPGGVDHAWRGFFWSEDAISIL